MLAFCVFGITLCGWSYCERVGLTVSITSGSAMAAGNALIQQRVCGVIPGLVERGCWKKTERPVGEQLKLGLPWGASSQCRPQRRVLVKGRSSKARAEMQTESAVAESQNGAYTMPTFPSFSNSPVSEHIGYGNLDEGNFYRERFVVRFSEVGDRRTMSLEMLSSLLQVPFLTEPLDEAVVLLEEDECLSCSEEGQLRCRAMQNLVLFTYASDHSSSGSVLLS